MKSITVEATGITPIILHSERGANPMDQLVKSMKEITSKRKKTDEDFVDISRIEWTLAMYFDEKIGPYIPGSNVAACLRDGAKLTKRGRDIQRGVRIEEYKVKLEYNGPRTLDKLWDCGDYADIRSVVVSRARIMRCRPIFHDWGITFNVLYNEETISRDVLIEVIESAGNQVGMCDYRPQFGLFNAKTK